MVTTLTLSAALALILNTFSPLLIQFFQHSAWPLAIKFVSASVVAAAIGVLSAYIAGQVTGLPLDWTGYVIDAAIVIPYAQAWYNSVWHPTGAATARLGIIKPTPAAHYTQADLDVAVAAALNKFNNVVPATPITAPLTAPPAGSQNGV